MPASEMLARGRIDEGRGFLLRVADGGEHFAGERVAFAVHDPLRGGVEGGVGRGVSGLGGDRPNVFLVADLGLLEGTRQEDVAGIDRRGRDTGDIPRRDDERARLGEVSNGDPTIRVNGEVAVDHGTVVVARGVDDEDAVSTHGKRLVSGAVGRAEVDLTVLAQLHRAVEVGDRLAFLSRRIGDGRDHGTRLDGLGSAHYRSFTVRAALEVAVGAALVSHRDAVLVERSRSVDVEGGLRKQRLNLKRRPRGDFPRHRIGFEVAVDLAAGVRAERDRVRDELGFFRHVKVGGHLDGLRSKVTVDFKRPGLDGLGVDRGGVRRQDPEGKRTRHLKRFDVLREDRAVVPREREGVVVREFHGSRPGVHAERADTHVTREGCGDRTFFRFADRDRVVRGGVADHLTDRGVFGGPERPVQNEVHLGLVVAQKVLNRHAARSYSPTSLSTRSTSAYWPKATLFQASVSTNGSSPSVAAL